MSDARRRMDRMYRHQRYVYDLTRRYFLLGRDAAIRRLGPPSGGCVLEVGCGTGRNLIKMARAYPEVRLFGLDGRIRLCLGDATDFEPGALFGVERFDRILYILLAFHDPAVAAGARTGDGAVLAPGGDLIVVDFGGQQGLPGWFRALIFSWLARFGVHYRGDMAAMLKNPARSLGHEVRHIRLLRGYAEINVVTARGASAEAEAAP